MNSGRFEEEFLELWDEEEAAEQTDAEQTVTDDVDLFSEHSVSKLTPGSEYQWSSSDNPDIIGLRLDRFVTDHFPELSRSAVQKWIDEGYLKVNNLPSKSGYKLRANDVIHLVVPQPPKVDLVPENIPIQIVFEDEDVIVVNKPRGMVVHPAAGNYTGTLVNALLYHTGQLSSGSAENRPGIVHRIDKDTSGLLMVAKNDHAHRVLAKQLSEHTTVRRYLAIVHGRLSHDVGTIDAPIGRHAVHRQRMDVVKQGRHAVTHFTVLERFEKYTFVECRLETGRTHQIRVHFEFIGHPLAGDPLYGPKKTLAIHGQALHAETLGFIHPRSGEYLEFHAPLPEDMKRLLQELRKE